MPRPKVRDERLREELLRAAISGLESEGHVALRARHVASSVGTSTAALYELFGDKAGLVRAIFYDGFQALLVRLEEVEETRDHRRGLVETLAASRRFALANPMLFELMYSRQYGEFEPNKEDRRVAATIYELVLRRVKRWVAEAGSGVDVVDAAHVLVALNRGLIAAELAGIQGRSRERRQRRWSLAVESQLDGLEQARPPQVGR